jgi:DNA-binding HxlR family transcriptional regulator
MNKKDTYEQPCSVDYAFKRIGGKYKGRIIWHLNVGIILRYGELKKLLNDITPKMLTQTLRELEDDKLIKRKVYHEVPPKVEYSLTDTGAEFICPSISHSFPFQLVANVPAIQFFHCIIQRSYQ